MLELTRQAESIGPTTILQRDTLASSPDTLYVLTCVGRAEEITAHPERCRAVFDSVIIEAPH